MAWVWKWYNGFSNDGYRPMKRYVLHKDGVRAGSTSFEESEKKVIDELVADIKNGGTLSPIAAKEKETSISSR